MALVVNGTTIKKLVVNGTNIKQAIANGVKVFVNEWVAIKNNTVTLGGTAYNLCWQTPSRSGNVYSWGTGSGCGGIYWQVDTTGYDKLVINAVWSRDESWRAFHYGLATNIGTSGDLTTLKLPNYVAGSTVQDHANIAVEYDISQYNGTYYIVFIRYSDSSHATTSELTVKDLYMA